MMSDQQNRPLVDIRSLTAKELAKALERYLPAPEWALLIALAAESKKVGQALYLVGGLVRDFLLGRDGRFPDLVIEGNAIDFAKLIAAKFGGGLETHKAFGTAKWLIQGKREEIAKALNIDMAGLPKALDFISSRKESYAEAGALPAPEFANIQADMRRRDFSINAIALRLDGEHLGELLDDLHAYEDLQNGTLRVLHKKSFEDDATRILRILRFRGRLGYKIEEETGQWLQQDLHFIESISGERIRNELDLALAEVDWAAIMLEMESMGVLRAIHPALTFNEDAKKALEHFSTMVIDSDWEVRTIPAAWLRIALWLMHQPARDIKSIMQRLNLEKQIRAAIVSAGKMRIQIAEFDDLAPSQITEKLDSLSSLARFILYVASLDLLGNQQIERHAKEWRHIQARSDGTSLKERGLEEGPRYSEILSALRAAWLDGEINSGDEEEKLLDQMIKNEGA